jgi:hypothetical protein
VEVIVYAISRPGLPVNLITRQEAVMPDVAEPPCCEDILFETPTESIHVGAHLGGPLRVTGLGLPYLDVSGTRHRVAELMRHNGTQDVRWKFGYTRAEHDQAVGEKLLALIVSPRSKLPLPLNAESRYVLTIDAPLAQRTVVAIR